MAANPVNTWEILPASGGAHRPSLADMGGAALANDTSNPPVGDGTQPTDAMLNQGQYQAYAQGQTAHSARITVKFSSGPVIDRLQTCSSLLSSANFTLTRTAGGAGAGDVTIDWLTGVLPPLICDPMVTINDVTQLTANAPLVQVVASPPAGHVQIRIVTPLAGTPTDMRFTVSV
jgi:hypothetical protein